MFGLGKTQPQQPVKDRVIVFDEDNKTCEILPIDVINEEVVKAGNKVLPRADLQLTLSKQGRVYVFRAPQHIVQLTEHLALVERNMIIRQIAQYKKPLDELKTDWFKYIMLGALLIVSIVAAAT